MLGGQSTTQKTGKRDGEYTNKCRRGIQGFWNAKVFTVAACGIGTEETSNVKISKKMVLLVKLHHLFMLLNRATSVTYVALLPLEDSDGGA